MKNMEIRKIFKQSRNYAISLGIAAGLTFGVSSCLGSCSRADFDYGQHEAEINYSDNISQACKDFRLEKARDIQNGVTNHFRIEGDLNKKLREAKESLERSLKEGEAKSHMIKG